VTQASLSGMKNAKQEGFILPYLPKEKPSVVVASGCGNAMIAAANYVGERVFELHLTC
jgi:hypothetical protein